MHDLVAQAVERFGRLDVMMCNAGFAIYGAIDDITPAQMHKLVDINYFGTYYATRAALPVFRRQGHGHVIIVSSIAGKRGVPYMGAYSATKFAQVGLAECLRAEVAGSDIHVSVVFPVSTDTEFREVMRRETGTRRQLVARTETDRRAGRRRDCPRDRPSGSGSLPAPDVARPRRAERDRAWILRPARQAIRPQAGARRHARTGTRGQPAAAGPREE